ncbi:MAG: heat-inducible transcriptional repressor HrcA [Gammaproteobacteria bacterium]|jgi:heat-inducible transcriptional repressor
MKASKQKELGERAQHLLRALVARYIADGTPVGSRTLSKNAGLSLSPATIRNIMSDLEELGFINSPHTSAGRVPTIKGYRYFVDTIVKFSPPNPDELSRLQQDFAEAGGDPQGIALSASNIISTMTSLAGVVTVPRRTHQQLRQIEFLPMSDKRVLAILVVNEKEVHNKILDVKRDFAADELRVASNYLTEQLSGRDLRQVRDLLLRELTDTRESMNAIMSDAIEMAEKAFPEGDSEDDGDFVLSGESKLLEIEELADLDTLRSLFEAFSRRRDILHLLDQSLNAEGVQIFIGQESGYELLDSVSIVAAPYGDDEDNMGVIGVIGPTRMAYERVIPIVDVTAKLLGRALKN